MKNKILIVDDEKTVYDSFVLICNGSYDHFFAQSGDEAMKVLKSENIDLVFLDINLPGPDGFEILEDIKHFDPSIEVVMVTADKNTKSTVRAIKLGAYDYVTKPFDVDEIELLIERVFHEKAIKFELNYLKETIRTDYNAFDIVGQDEALLHMLRMVEKVSRVQSTVLVTGESGTGKELVARAIHKKSEHANDPFVAVNCGAIPDLLLESELFGHEKGAFTGAYDKKIGKFELARSGTIFLDEISNMPERLQAKLLRVLQEREIERLGGNRLIEVQARVIAATNVDLLKCIADGTFRKDLYYRLNVVHIDVPPLRERKSDIPLLVDHFLRQFNKRFNTRVKRLTDEALQAFMNYSWPGNVRELSNIIERLVLLTDDDTIGERNVPLEILVPSDLPSRIDEYEDIEFSFKRERAKFEYDMIVHVLHSVNFSQTKAAKVLNIHRNTLLAKMQQLNIDIIALKKAHRKTFS